MCHLLSPIPVVFDHSMPPQVPYLIASHSKAGLSIPISINLNFTNSKSGGEGASSRTAQVDSHRRDIRSLVLWSSQYSTLFSMKPPYQINLSHIAQSPSWKTTTDRNCQVQSKREQVWSVALKGGMACFSSYWVLTTAKREMCILLISMHQPHGTVLAHIRGLTMYILISHTAARHKKFTQGQCPRQKWRATPGLPQLCRSRLTKQYDFSCPWQEALLSHPFPPSCPPISSATTLYIRRQARLFFLGTFENKLKVCVHVPVYVYEDVCVYVWYACGSQKSTSGVTLQMPICCYWDRVTLTWSVPNRLGWLASKHQKSACSWLTIIKTSILPCLLFLYGFWNLNSCLHGCTQVPDGLICFTSFYFHVHRVLGHPKNSLICGTGSLMPLTVGSLFYSAYFSVTYSIPSLFPLSSTTLSLGIFM